MTSDIGYRAKITQAYNDRVNNRPSYFYGNTQKGGTWFGRYSSMLGIQGISDDIYGIKTSMRSNGYRKGEYEIWKIYIGTELPGHPDWFPPEQVPY